MDDGLSAQDKADLAQVRKALPEGDPRRAKIDTLIGPEAVSPPDKRNAFQRGVDNLTRYAEHPEDRGAGQPNLANKFGGGVFRGFLGPLAHPILALQSMKAAAAPAQSTVGKVADTLVPGSVAGYRQIRDLAKGFEEDPAGTAGQVVGGLGLGEAGGEVVGAATDAAGNMMKSGSRILTGTSSRNTGALVRDATEENANNVKNAASANEKNAADRKTELKGYFDKKKAADAAKAEAQTAIDRKAAAAHGVEQADETLRSDLDKTKAKVKAEADQRYANQRAELNDREIPYNGATAENPEMVTSANFVPKVTEAWDSAITGSDTRPAIIKSIEERINSAEPLTWKDYQGYRSEIGKKLTSGTLPGDEYYGYKKVLGVVDDAMQQIADHNGMGKQVADDRAFYSQYMDTFHDPKSPVYKALKAQERGGTVKAFRGADRTGIEAVAKYDPDLAKRLASTRDVQAVASAPVKAVPAKPEPKLAPAKPEVIPETRTISPEDIRKQHAAKLQANADRAANIGQRSADWRIAGGLTALGGAIAHSGIAELAGVGALAAPFATEAYARFLERPGVVDFLTKVTQADIDKVPPELRSQSLKQLEPVVRQAQKQGVKVSPVLLKALGASAAIPKNHPLAQAPAQ